MFTWFFFADADVGPSAADPNYPNNNLAGYIDSIHTAFVYNPLDPGSTPLGITILKTPIPMDSLHFIFHWFANAGDEPTLPNDSAEYGWLSGSAFAPNLIEPNQAQISDTRFFFSFGPFSHLAPGDTLKISLALISGYGISVGNQSLIANAEKALALSGRDYFPPVTPPSPALRITPGPNSVTLKWGTSVGLPDPTVTWDSHNILAQSFPDTNWRRINPPCGSGPANCNFYQCTLVNGKPFLPGGRVFLGYNLYRSEDPNLDSPAPNSFSLLQQYILPEAPNVTGYPSQWNNEFVDSNITKGKTYWYAVTSVSLPDIAITSRRNMNGSISNDTMYTGIHESGILDNATKVNLQFATSDKLNQVLVVPNPYRGGDKYPTGNQGAGDIPSNGVDNNLSIKFIHLPKQCTIRIFTVAGDLITTLNYTAPPKYPTSGEFAWNLFSESNRPIASGLYIFSVESNLGTQVGKFVIIR